MRVNTEALSSSIQESSINKHFKIEFYFILFTYQHAPLTKTILAIKFSNFSDSYYPVYLLKDLLYLK